MIQVMTMRFSQARDSSTVRPEREKFIITRATAAVTMAAMVEIPRIWVYTSFITSLALAQMVVAEAGRYSSGDTLTVANQAYSQRPGSGPRPGELWDGMGCLVKQIPPLLFWAKTKASARFGCWPIAVGHEKDALGVLPQSFSLVITVLSILSLTYMESYVNFKTISILSQNCPNFVSQRRKRRAIEKPTFYLYNRYIK